ncbi:MAG: hypothetical protein WD801_04295 [Gemmatimonadaceae bacterium]
MAGIRIVPEEIWAAPSEQFVVRARLIDEWGNVYPDDRAGELSWTSADLTLEGAAKGPVVVASLPVGATGASRLTAELEGYEPVSIPVYASIAGIWPTEIDLARVKPEPATPPVLFMLDGMASSRVEDTLIAIVGRGALDYFSCSSTDPKCGEITIFSTRHGLVRQTDVQWGDRCDDVDAHNPSSTSAACVAASPVKVPLPAIRTVPVQYVVLASGARTGSVSSDAAALSSAINLEESILIEIGFAARVFAEGWTGLDLSLAPGIVIPGLVTSVTLAIGADDPCMSQDTPVGEQLIGVTVDPSKITVAYVQEIMALGGEDITWAKGFACPWNNRFGSIVLVSWNGASPTTLAHELAHALGPWQTESPWGHTEGIAGFNESNILWNYEADYKPGPRSQVTLGQAFRMSLDGNAFFHRGTASSFPRCQFWPTTADPDTPCPRLSRGVASP